MRFALTAGAVVAAASGVVAQGCASGTAFEDNGNWYCSAVKAITYTGLTDNSGSYNRITAMDSASGTCSSTSQGFGGTLSPLDEEVSLHIRGPMRIKQIAVYTPSSDDESSKKRSIGRRRRHRRHHGHAHGKREAEPEPDMVTATIDGQVVSWVNTYFGPTSASEAMGTIVPTTTAATASSIVSAAESPATFFDAGSGNWGRQAYYNAESGTASGLVFLNHFGGTESGVWDDVFGSSLSYASADGTTGASCSQTLEDVFLDDDAELVIMTDTECGDSDCGYVRNGSVAYHGWSGSQKAFLLEFSMPLTGKTGFDADMPAIWLLNAQIPRTLQYGQSDCSCWTSGCGEWDIFEILDAGNTKAKSTIHMNISGGDSNYFDRPTDDSIKVAVVFEGDSGEAHIQIIDDGTSFDETITGDVMKKFCSLTKATSHSAVFDMTS
ncbi:MAG: target of Sbf [Cirrosporium novae-zelandiae]|nr:MAG: target of Sbf [Cirrosporium novae-zelandiae]KAI9735611.1 MAG: target of Sbf [Cirrosporium novae-zelandiae]